MRGSRLVFYCVVAAILSAGCTWYVTNSVIERRALERRVIELQDQAAQAFDRGWCLGAARESTRVFWTERRALVARVGAGMQQPPVTRPSEAAGASVAAERFAEGANAAGGDNVAELQRRLRIPERQ